MMKIIFALFVIGFVFFCGILVVESGFFKKPSQVKPGCILLQNVADNAILEPNDTSEPDTQQLQAAGTTAYDANHAPVQTMTIGSVDPKSGYKFQLELTPKGAAIRKAIFSEFDNRDRKDPKPLVFISPVPIKNGNEICVMANTG
ncbi:MAG: hypothetical protein JXM79_16450, partial [Sedimentisphaerales bacterium]|nr:hypothetical protein [Sedimentisphaerales bacterium]